jgi:hypothetical protein
VVREEGHAPANQSLPSRPASSRPRTWQARLFTRLIVPSAASTTIIVAAMSR